MLGAIGLALAGGAGMPMFYEGRGSVGSSRRSSGSRYASSSSDRYPVFYLTKMSDQQFQERFQKWASLIIEWNATASPKLKMLDICDSKHGKIMVMCTSPSNGYKRSKKFLAEAGIHPDTSIEDIMARLSTILKTEELKGNEISTDQDQA